MSGMKSLIRQIYPARTFAIAMAISVIVWFAGPLGTFQAMGPLFRFFFWAGLILASVPFAYMVRVVLTRRLPRLSPALLILAISVGFSAVYSPIVLVFFVLSTRFGVTHLIPWWKIWAATFLAAATVYTVRTLLFDGLKAPAGDVPADLASEPRSDPPRLVRRLDDALHGRLVSISVRDHYVDVRTEAGQASLLLRFSDAIAETEGVDGAQVHRSHWVAWDAVEGVDRIGTNLLLRLKHGETIPVSRNHRKTLETRGLI